MKSFILICAFFFGLSNQDNAIQEGERLTYQLSDTTFTSLVQNSSVNENWFIMLHSPNCQHCTKFKPTFYNSAYEHKDSGVNFGEVNCIDEDNLCSRLRIKYYPSIILVKDKLIYRFQGQRTLNDLKYFIKEGHKQQEGIPIPEFAPTIWENTKVAFEEIKRELYYVFTTEGNYMMKGIMVLFFFLLFSVFVIVVFMLRELFYARK